MKKTVTEPEAKQAIKESEQSGVPLFNPGCGIAPFPLPDSEKVQTEFGQREKPEMENDETGNSFCTKCNQALPVAIGYRDSPSLGRAARNSSLANVSFPASSTVVRFLKKSLTTLAETSLKWISETALKAAVPNVWYFFVGLYLFSRWILVGTVGIWGCGLFGNWIYFHQNNSEWHEGNMPLPYLAWARTWLMGVPVAFMVFVIVMLIAALHHFGEMHVKYRHIKLPPGPGPG